MILVSICRGSLEVGEYCIEALYTLNPRKKLFLEKDVILEFRNGIDMEDFEIWCRNYSAAEYKAE